MQRLRTRYRAEALRDLAEIYRRVYLVSSSPDVANRFVNRIRAKCRRIGDVPYGGVARDDLEPGLRLTPFERKAVIVYKIEADCVRISNIFYGGRDYETLYRDDDTQ